MQWRAGMAGVAETLAEIPVRGALTAGGWGERPAREALVAVVDVRSDPRDPVDMAGVAARRRAGHNGGSDLGLPNRGATLGELLSPVEVCSILGLWAANFSGSRINSSVGSHSSTAQMTSRSSSRDGRGSRPQGGHLPGAQLQASVGESPTHLG